MKSKKSTLIIIMVLFTLIKPIISQPNYNFAYSFGIATGNSFGTITTGVATDVSGNLYSCGAYAQTVDFDPSSSVVSLTTPSINYISGFLCKYSATGSIIWAKSIGDAVLGNTAQTQIKCITIDAVGNVVVGGYYFADGSVDFDPNSGMTLLGPTGGHINLFIAKYDSNGSFIWVKTVGSATEMNNVYDIKTDNSGNVYTTGYVYGSVSFGAAGTLTSGSASGSSVNNSFVAKQDINGNWLWAKSFFTNNAVGSMGYGIDVDANGNVYTVGQSGLTTDFDPGIVINNSVANGSYVSKLDASGNFVFAKIFAGTTECNSIKLDALNNIYTTGVFMTTVDFDPNAGVQNLTSAGGEDIFISKLDALGNYVFALRVGGTNTTGSFNYDYEAGRKIDFDNHGNIIVAGNFNSLDTDFDPSSTSSYTIASHGINDVFILKLDNNGSFLCAGGMGGTNKEYLYDIALSDSLIYMGGSLYSNTADFDPSLSTHNISGVVPYSAYLASYDVSTCTSTLTTSVKNIEKNNVLEVYPNPATNVITVKIANSSNYMIEIYDCLGQLQIKKQLNSSNQINIDELNSGTYFLKVTNNTGNVITKKFCKL